MANLPNLKYKKRGFKLKKVAIIVIVLGLLFFTAIITDQPAKDKVEINSTITFSDKDVAEGGGYKAEVTIGSII